MSKMDQLRKLREESFERQQKALRQGQTGSAQRVGLQTGDAAALRALAKRKPVTKSLRAAVAKIASVTKLTPAATVGSAGRPRVHKSGADRQRAYRERQRAGA